MPVLCPTGRHQEALAILLTSGPITSLQKCLVAYCRYWKLVAIRCVLNIKIFLKNIAKLQCLLKQDSRANTTLYQTKTTKIWNLQWNSFDIIHAFRRSDIRMLVSHSKKGVLLHYALLPSVRGCRPIKQRLLVVLLALK